MSDNIELSDEYFLDAVSEILNIGMGYAASVLSDMVREEVKLSVPGIKFVSRHDAVKLIQAKTNREVSGVCQHFEGVMGGEVLLLFPEDKSLQLVRAILQQDIPLADLTEMEQEAMTEIGNVILNGCLCSIADLFGREIKGGIPEFIKGSLNNILSNNKLADKIEACVLMLNMEFSLDKQNIEGYVSFLMDVESMSIFKQNVQQYVAI
jgi:chemotaxis protein CheC